jgi:hypothetical protein
MAFLKHKLWEWYSGAPMEVCQTALLDWEDKAKSAAQEPSAVTAIVQVEDGLSCSTHKFNSESAGSTNQNSSLIGMHAMILSTIKWLYQCMISFETRVFFPYS